MENLNFWGEEAYTKYYRVCNSERVRSGLTWKILGCPHPLCETPHEYN